MADQTQGAMASIPFNLRMPAGFDGSRAGRAVPNEFSLAWHARPVFRRWTLDV